MIGPDKHIRAIRWQYPQLINEKKVKNRRFVFVGLGNSTAEMLQIVQSREYDYRVLTHYPQAAVMNPQTTVMYDGKNYRVFRDLSEPNLTSYQGDLAQSRVAYYRALMEGKIISDVVQWDVTKNETDSVLSIKRRGESELSNAFHFDDIYILTGYQHTAASLVSMGISYDADHNPCYDYDGEFQTSSNSEDRLYKGYFGFGGVLNATHNKNAIVIPGMIFRTPDLLFGVLMRAIEYYTNITKMNNRYF
jgi:hypothetical protein